METESQFDRLARRPRGRNHDDATGRRLRVPERVVVRRQEVVADVVLGVGHGENNTWERENGST